MLLYYTYVSNSCGLLLVEHLRKKNVHRCGILLKLLSCKNNIDNQHKPCLVTRCQSWALISIGAFAEPPAQQMPKSDVFLPAGGWASGKGM